MTTTTPTNDNATLAGGAAETANAMTTPALYSDAEPPLPIVCNPREFRALVALLARDLSRETLDRTVGCSNGPDLVKRCRERYRLALPCVMIPARDRDGHEVRYGKYSPTPADRHRMRLLLSRGRVQ